MKQIQTILLSLLLLAVFSVGCSARQAEAPQTITLQIGSPLMRVDGAETEVDPGRGTAPILEGERTLLPLRAVVEAMGGTVEWEAETQTTLLAKGDVIVLLTIGGDTAFVNETQHTLDAAPIVQNGRTMLPIRLIAESFGYTVAWDEGAQTVTLTAEEGEGE